MQLAHLQDFLESVLDGHLTALGSVSDFNILNDFGVDGSGIRTSVRHLQHPG